MKVIFSRLLDVFCIVIVILWLLPRKIRWKLTNFFLRKNKRHVCGNCFFFRAGKCIECGEPCKENEVADCDIFAHK